jgi:class 3 adenylate cyclase/tetratricopeptide (TPR) repeat protein
MAEGRKTVTVVFADVAGSTELGERLDPEALRRVMERYFATARAVLARHGGTVEKFIGDAVVAVFGIPAAHEDDALRAVRAAAEMREALATLNEELSRERDVTLAVRTGVNTGEVFAGDPAQGQFYATGDAVNVAARLEQAAAPGEVLLGEETYGLVRGAVRVERVEPLSLKGKAAAISAWRLGAVVEGAAPFARRFDTPFVGRREELARLSGCFERSLSERAPVLVTVFGAAGIGKTRLAAEFSAQASERARVLTGRCLAYGEGITFWPLLEMLRSLPERPADVPDPEQARTTEETFFAFRKLFETLAQERPLVLVLEDVHWGAPTMLDLVEHVVDWTREAPIMIVCLARPEFLEARPGWPGEHVELDPLPDEEAEAIVTALAPGLGPGTRARATEAAEGNPLFLEQLLALAGEEDRHELAVPPTIQALLAARLDRLGQEERALLERASVVGTEFWRGALARLSPPETEVSALLQRLVRRRLVRPERSSFPGQDAFRFGHALIREATYRGISKEVRADTHERFADWLEASGRPYEEIVGYHLEQAYWYRAELRPVDDHGRSLARRAAGVFSAAGARAHARHDHAVAANLLARSVDLLPREDPLRLSLLPQLGDDLFWLGRYDEARSILADAVEGSRRGGDRDLEWRARIGQLRLDAQGGTEITKQELERGAEVALAVFDELEDAGGQAWAWYLLGMARSSQFRNEAATRALEQAAACARLAGDDALEASCLGLLSGVLIDGPMPVAEVIERAEKALAAASTRMLEQVLLWHLAYLHAEQGRFDRAKDFLGRARALTQEFGTEIDVALAASHGGDVERLGGDAVAAEEEFRRSYEILERLGETTWRSTVAADLAGTLVDQDRLEEAEHFLEISGELAASDDLASQVTLHSIRARVEVERGRLDVAERLARDALSLLEGTDAFDARAGALLNLGEVLRRTGRTEEACSAAAEALGLCEMKGNMVRAKEARGILEELTD